MKLTFRQIGIFVAIADNGSTSAAGERIGLSQSATSGALKELESLLGTPLFDRIGKRLLLNDSGRAALPQARALLAAGQDLETRFLGGHGGGSRLRVAASTTIGNYLLPALVAGYQRTWPATAIEVDIGNTRDVAAAVARLEVDLGLIEGPCHQPDLRVMPWREDPLVIVCAADHALRKAGRVPLVALRSARWLQREPGSGTREAVEHALLPHLHHLEGSLLLGSTEAIKQAAAEGMGLACLSACAVQDLVTLGRLVVLETTLPRLSRRFYRVHHRQKHFSAEVQKFSDHLGGA
ncbi:LysR family transcriptional regulator [Xylophilus sp. Kf1]|nr:LysR family transcriptional regulator [Xylophilus sp. Kf1]